MSYCKKDGMLRDSNEIMTMYSKLWL